MPGFTAYMGLLDIGQPQPGETLVVAAATGPVGATVGQIGKLKGCNVVGVAGGQRKCDYAVTELGFDRCLDHTAPNFEQALNDACPKGVDIYFENVGGRVFDAILPLLNTCARIPLCGVISRYNATELPIGRDRLPLLIGQLLKKRVSMKGFIVTQDYANRYQEFSAQMSSWLRSGAIKSREDILEGLEAAPSGFIGLLKGQNFGKLIVRVGPDV
jgi:NADPH-dependent curcumin reductase CurA